ncbi:MAG TPA: hypothetical protein DCQ08_02845, partial [Amoebophilaceae bacterium]|nr:hypothetical protein [Amoebophilaceae bacterium]
YKYSITQCIRPPTP